MSTLSSKVITSTLHTAWLICLLVYLVSSQGIAQEHVDFTGGLPFMEPADSSISVRTIIVRPKSTTDNTASSLYPNQDKLRPGNAAPIIIRQAAEATERNKALRQLLSLKLLDAPLSRLDPAEVIKLTPIQFSELRRAAFREHGGWEYPLNEVPLGYVFLPDVQETRLYNMAIAARARTDLITGQLPEALDKICIGFGLAKHVGETPFVVCKLNHCAQSTTLLRVLEEYIQHPKSENQYWGIAQLPFPLVNIQPAMQLETKMWEKTFTELASLETSRTEVEWQDLFRNIYVDLASSGNELPGFGTPEAAAIIRSWNLNARESLTEIWKDEERKVEQMSDSETAVRYWYSRVEKISSRQKSWAQLRYHQSLPKLLASRTELESFPPEEKLVKLAVSDDYKTVTFAAFLQQHVGMLQTVESIRDWSAKNKNQLPTSLDVLELPAAEDCIANKPYDYSRSKDGRAATLEGAVLNDRGFRYELVLE